jgi:GDPmannose 4,6-dehydratase
MLHLIIGHNGQDGTILKQKIENLNEIWIGIDRYGIFSSNSLSLSSKDIYDISSMTRVEYLVSNYKPDKIFYLAAHHYSSTFFIDSNISNGLTTNVIGPLNFLNAIYKFKNKTKFLYVSSSLIYKPIESIDEQIIESSIVMPIENYSHEKLLTGQYCKYFRDNFNIYASVAIPFNHDSKYRKKGFFTRDATDAIARIHLGFSEFWEVGSINSIVDMLHADDVVEAFIKILDLDLPDDFIIASGIGHTTGEFLTFACNYIGLDISKVIKVNNKKIFRENKFRIGKSQKLFEKTGWKQIINFETLVKLLMDEAIIRIKKESN